MRQVVLDTETTGLEPGQGHRILEIGCVEILDRKITGRHFHNYINPKREIDDGALEVHGITRGFLQDKPEFKDIWDDFLAFVDQSELIIHNAAFDVAFLNNEISIMLELDDARAGMHKDVLLQRCTIVDTLRLARQKHPGQKNSLDALCKRYLVDNSQRDLHGALLDAEILADVYLALTGGQVDLGLESSTRTDAVEAARRSRNKDGKTRHLTRVILANPDELAAHESKLEAIDNQSSSGVIWHQLEQTES